MVDGHKEYVVERILRHRWVPKWDKAVRRRTQQKEYLVKWLGDTRNTTESWRSEGELNTGGMLSRHWLDYETLLGDEAAPPLRAKRKSRLGSALVEYEDERLTHVNRTGGKAPMRIDNRHRTPRVLVLFSGTGSV